MKCYFPTSTLNFDCILSSQKVFPSLMYKSGTLWWNHFEMTSGDDGRTIVLYTKCPKWTIADLERDNYPMVLEIDRPFKKSEIVELGGLKAVVLHRPLEFSQLDMAQGKVRFLFRNEKEMRRTTGKAFIGVSECKVSVSVDNDYPEACGLMPTATNKLCDLGKASAELRDKLAEVAVEPVEECPVKDYREERVRGAELGYQVGRFVKALRFGCFLDAFRIPLSFDEWRARILPEPFSLILDKFCSRGELPWDPNRAAMVTLCKDIWYECFNGKRVDGILIKSGTPIHASLQQIAQHWATPEVAYKIGTEKNVYMQAYAAFLECGTSVSKYHRLANDQTLKCPEFLFALYGAIVGYTFFSRSLLDIRAYSEFRSTPFAREVQPATGALGSAMTSDAASRIKSNLNRGSASSDGGTDVNQQMQFPPQRGAAHVSNGQMDLFEALDEKQMMSDKSVLVDDPTLADAVRIEFSYMVPERLEALIRVIKGFAKKYSFGEYYGSRPEKYRRTNPDLIQHLLSCMSSQNEMVRDLNFSWDSPDEKLRFEHFLKERYIKGIK